jgi:hypothetical protein
VDFFVFAFLQHIVDEGLEELELLSNDVVPEGLATSGNVAEDGV